MMRNKQQFDDRSSIESSRPEVLLMCAVFLSTFSSRSVSSTLCKSSSPPIYFPTFAMLSIVPINSSMCSSYSRKAHEYGIEERKTYSREDPFTRGQVPSSSCSRPRKLPRSFALAAGHRRVSSSRTFPSGFRICASFRSLDFFAGRFPSPS